MSSHLAGLDDGDVGNGSGRSGLRRRREGMILLGVRWRQPGKEREFFEMARRDEFGLEFELLEGWLVGEEVAADFGATTEAALAGSAGRERRDGGKAKSSSSTTTATTATTTKTAIDALFRDMPALPWSQYGNLGDDDEDPSSDGSTPFVRYLRRTTVSTRGGARRVPLMDLTESDLDGMNDAEHGEFERTQVQLYVGRRRRHGRRRCQGSDLGVARQQVGPKRIKK